MAKESDIHSVCIFEDHKFPNLFPLSLNKPVFEIFLGTDTLRNRIIKDINPERVSLHCRPYMAEDLEKQVITEKNEFDILINEVRGETVFINSRIMAFGDDLRELTEEVLPDSVMVKNDVPVLSRLSEEKSRSFLDFLLGITGDNRMDSIIENIRKISETENKEEDEGDRFTAEFRDWADKSDVNIITTNQKLFSRHWHLIGFNADCIRDDFSKNPLRGKDPDSELFTGVELINEADIVIGSEVEVRSGTVLDASEGPILIDDSVLIEPNAIINGPCFIGRKCIIRAGAKVGSGTSLGRGCRVGGEVEETVIASCSNKQHIGFLGHSYIGSWVNIGAGTCNSDLKNNYGTVRAWNAGRKVKTGRRFLGSVVGDHTKIAINSRLDTGTVIGFNSNLIEPGFPPKFIPSFIWKMKPEMTTFDLKKAVRTAELMMDRRDIKITKARVKLFETLYKYCRQSGYTI
ncbi:MAG: putative sugar nucleotidyl transferase [Candidatus Krumholzibacteriales bacterium]